MSTSPPRTRRRIGNAAAIAIMAVSATVAISAVSSGGPADGEAELREVQFQIGTVERPFGDAFNGRIRASPVIDRRSGAIASYLAGESGYAVLYDYGTPIYYANRFTPRVRVECTTQWGICDLENKSVPVPVNAEPNSGSDAAMVVVDQTSGRVFEFWQARELADGSWETSWGEVVSVASRGGFGSTGSGISRLAGVIRMDEIRTGVIPHALTFSTDNACRSEFRAPATKSDGTSELGNCIPQGARIQLDPDIDLDLLPLSRAERAVGVALQDYGAYVTDNGGARIAIGFERPTDGSDPYPAAGLPWDYYRMDKIPWAGLRVLRRWDGA